LSSEIKIIADDNAITWDRYDALILPIHAKEGLDAALVPLPRPLVEETKRNVHRFEFTLKPGRHLAFDSSTARRIVLACYPLGSDLFPLLEWARKCLLPVRDSKAKNIFIDLRTVRKNSDRLADAFVSAWDVGHFELPNYRAKKKKEEGAAKKESITLTFSTPDADPSRLETKLRKSRATAAGTNLVRQLSTLAGNDLTPTRYVQLASQIARDAKLQTEFYSLEKLKKKGAGAFLAVAQASDDRGGGILKVRYQPRVKNDLASVTLVGKGITFDTGGVNIKTGSYLYDMHMDMAGSAVALATTITAAKMDLPLPVTAYLAITDNAIGPKGYRPNDIVTSLQGRTIEIIDTDAEGRMILADTLTLAAEEESTLLMDFATLTGSCVRALGTSISGVYSNHRRLYPHLVRAGRRSGERVWPLPNDADYGRCLKSDVADIKQCRLTGGSDHIEASYFLSRFVPRRQPWVHVDLSASKSEGGLAHVPSKTTGFGVRFAIELIERLLLSKGGE